MLGREPTSDWGTRPEILSPDSCGCSSVSPTGSSPARTNQTVATHSAVAPATWTAAENRRDVAEVLDVADAALEHRDEHPRRELPAEAGRQIGRASQDDDERQEDRHGDPHRDAVQFGDGGDVEAVAAGRLVAGVRTGAGDDGAGDQRRRHEDAERHEQPGDERCHTDVVPDARPVRDPSGARRRDRSRSTASPG